MRKPRQNAITCRMRLLTLSLVVVLTSCALATNVLAAQPAGQVTNQAGTTAVSAPPATTQKEKFNLKQIEIWLKQQYKVAKRSPNSSNPFPTLVRRSDKGHAVDPSDSQYEVYDVRTFDDKGFFRHQKIILISVSTIFLEARIKVADRSTGMFALDGRKLTYLNGTDSAINVSKVLQTENRPLSEADPQMLASFFASTVLRQGNNRVDVVQTPDEILKMDRPNAAKVNAKLKQKGLKRFYATTVFKPELAKCKDKFIKPEISFKPKSGWTCTFIGLRGYLHTIRVPFALVKYSITVSPTFVVKAQETILSDKIII